MLYLYSNSAARSVKMKSCSKYISCELLKKSDFSIVATYLVATRYLSEGPSFDISSYLRTCILVLY
jgi:hypothetical protein